MVANSNWSRVQELCWDAHESASLERGGWEAGGEGPWRAAQGGSRRCRALGRELRWLVGPLALHQLLGAGFLQGALLILSSVSCAGLGHQETWL